MFYADLLIIILITILKNFSVLVISIYMKQILMENVRSMISRYIATTTRKVRKVLSYITFIAKLHVLYYFSGGFH